MKKVIALLLGALTLLTLFAACGEKAPAETTDVSGAPDAQTEETTAPETDTAAPAGSDTTAPATDTSAPTAAETPDETPHYRKYDNPYQEAVCLFAESMLQRHRLVQYDDTRLVNYQPVAVYRWQRKTKAPEDYTKQLLGYTNCACFTYDCYYEALDYDIKYWYVRMYYAADPEEIMYSYDVKGDETPEDIARLKEEFVKILEPGDCICYLHDDSGHAMLYAGEGRVIHSQAPGGGNYDYSSKKDRVEPVGSISLDMIDDLFTPGYVRCLPQQKSYIICRPLNKFKGGEVPEKSKNRAKNLQNVVVQKLCSKTIGQVIMPGEELTYTFDIQNLNNWKMDLEVRDVVPENTTYVSGADSVSGRNLSWDITVPKGERMTVSYTVKVNDDNSLYGKKIFNDKATVGGVPCKTPAVYVRKHLSDDEKTKLAGTMDAVSKSGASVFGLELAKSIYKDAIGMDISAAVTDEKSLMGTLFTPQTADPGIYDFNEDNKYFPLVAPAMYGGYYVLSITAFDGIRTRGPQTQHLEAGDIVVISDNKEDTETQVYMVGAGNKIMCLNPGAVRMLDVAESNDILMGILGYTKFVILRPAMTLK
ncbi:MAG: DUF11 domain-containing protein [Clostridia bacterium]|nr:DUF11 domain-containing protein [Clostridia bacterium]